MLSDIALRLDYKKSDLNSERSPRRARGLRKPPRKGIEPLAQRFKSEIQNTKHEIRLRRKWNKYQWQNQFRFSGESGDKRIEQFYSLLLSSCLDRFEHLDIRIWDLFRISRFGFRIFQASLVSHRIGRIFLGPLLKVAFNAWFIGYSPRINRFSSCFNTFHPRPIFWALILPEVIYLR